MSLTRADIEKIAQLARLDLTEAEIPVYVDSLSRIMDFVGELERAGTAGLRRELLGEERKRQLDAQARHPA